AQLARSAGSAGPGRGGRVEAAVAAVGVGVRTCTLVERTVAPTYDYLTGAPSPTRTLVTAVRYPTRAPGGSGEVARAGAPPARVRGGYPAVVFAAGYRLDPSAYASLLDAWVRTGLVVVAPVFPYTNPVAVAAALRVAPTADPERDLANEPADVAFVAGQVVAGAGGRGGCRLLAGLVDPAALGLAGQSDGGQAVGMLAYDRNDQLVAPPFRAVEVLSGGPNGTDPYVGGPGHPSLLVVESSRDTCNTPAEAAALYDGVAIPDKWFLEDHAASHLGPYVGTARRTAAVVAAMTGRFFDLELRGGAPGAVLARLAGTAPGVAVLTHAAVAPTMPWRGGGGVACYAR
ncbi:MAG: hypothetical protein M0T71_03830, partial [Actinomycetota bacterium]|nr:hypothetical protein [Actinomycetota bacterium]